MGKHGKTWENMEKTWKTIEKQWETPGCHMVFFFRSSLKFRIDEGLELRISSKIGMWSQNLEANVVVHPRGIGIYLLKLSIWIPPNLSSFPAPIRIDQLNVIGESKSCREYCRALRFLHTIYWFVLFGSATQFNSQHVGSNSRKLVCASRE